MLNDGGFFVLGSCMEWVRAASILCYNNRVHDTTINMEDIHLLGRNEKKS